MKDLRGKIVFITGATSGIGRSTAYAFAGAGCKLILIARRIELLSKLAEDLKNEHNCSILTGNVDVRDLMQVENFVNSIGDEFRSVDVLVNNAGLARGFSGVHNGSVDDWNEMIDTNIKGILHVSRCILPGMAERKSGHVINIGSIAGNEVYPNGNVYCATKHAVEALTQGMRMDLNGTGVRVTTVNPGLVETEFSLVRYRGDKDKASVVYNGMTPLTPDDVADAVFYAATRDDNFVVASMELLPLAQASAMVVDRKS